MRNKDFGGWLKSYAVCFIYGAALIIICLMCAQMY